MLQVYEIGLKSLPLTAIAAFAIGVVLALQTLVMLRKFGAVHYVAVVVGLCSLPAPALAGGAKHPQHYRYGYAGQYRHYYNRHYYPPPVRYYAPPVRYYYAPPVRYYAYPPYQPGINVQIAIPFPFFSFYLW